MPDLIRFATETGPGPAKATYEARSDEFERQSSSVGGPPSPAIIGIVPCHRIPATQRSSRDPPIEAPCQNGRDRTGEVAAEDIGQIVGADKNT